MITFLGNIKYSLLLLFLPYNSSLIDVSQKLHEWWIIRPVEEENQTVRGGKAKHARWRKKPCEVENQNMQSRK